MLRFVTTTAIMALAIASPHIATAQTPPPSPTKALVNIIVAEQFCAMRMPPKEIITAIGGQAVEETGLDMPQMVDASYIAATAIGNAYRADGTLPGFCLRMAEIYSGSGW
jgi:hypothetical protein